MVMFGSRFGWIRLPYLFKILGLNTDIALRRAVKTGTQRCMNTVEKLAEIAFAVK